MSVVLAVNTVFARQYGRVQNKIVLDFILLLFIHFIFYYVIKLIRQDNYQLVTMVGVKSVGT